MFEFVLLTSFLKGQAFCPMMRNILLAVQAYGFDTQLCHLPAQGFPRMQPAQFSLERKDDGVSVVAMQRGSQ